MENTTDQTSQEIPEIRRYREEELNLMDKVRRPSLNPWLSMILLFLLGFFYIWLWGVALKG